MTEVQIGLGGLVVLFALIALRMPVGIALIGVSFGGLWYLMGWGIAWDRWGSSLTNSPPTGCSVRYRCFYCLATFASMPN